jgi:hypothetical protein
MDGLIPHPTHLTVCTYMELDRHLSKRMTRLKMGEGACRTKRNNAYITFLWPHNTACFNVIKLLKICIYQHRQYLAIRQDVLTSLFYSVEWCNECGQQALKRWRPALRQHPRICLDVPRNAVKFHRQNNWYPDRHSISAHLGNLGQMLPIIPQNILSFSINPQSRK